MAQRISLLTNALQHAARVEWSILIAVLVLAGALWGFIELADEVVEGATDSADRAILLAFRTADGNLVGPGWLHEMMRDFSALGGVGVLTLLTLLAAGYLRLVGARRAMIHLLLSVGGGVLLSTAFKTGFGRPRPDLVSAESYVSTASFPSGHSMMAAIVYLTLAALLARVQVRWQARAYLISCAVLLTILVGLSRVYLGVHWPTDVLGGWSAGAAWALLCWLAAVWLQARGRIEGGNVSQPVCKREGQ